MEEKPKRPRGRPPGSELTEFLGMRVSPSLKARVVEFGQPWARDALEQAPPPKPKKTKSPKSE